MLFCQISSGICPSAEKFEWQDPMWKYGLDLKGQLKLHTWMYHLRIYKGHKKVGGGVGGKQPNS